MATDKFTYDVYPGIVKTQRRECWITWHADIRLRATGERVYQTIRYNAMDDAVGAALDWMDDHMDSFDDEDM